MPHHELGQNTTSMRWLSKLRNSNKTWTVAINASHPRAEHFLSISKHCSAFDEHCWVFLSRIIVSLKNSSSVSLGFDLIWQISLLPFPSIFTHKFFGKHLWKCVPNTRELFLLRAPAYFQCMIIMLMYFLIFFIVMLNDTLFCV